MDCIFFLPQPGVRLSIPTTRKSFKDTKYKNHNYFHISLMWNMSDRFSKNEILRLFYKNKRMLWHSYKSCVLETKIKTTKDDN